jgi:hypothetical protein
MKKKAQVFSGTTIAFRMVGNTHAQLEKSVAQNEVDYPARRQSAINGSDVGGAKCDLSTGEDTPPARLRGLVGKGRPYRF